MAIDFTAELDNTPQSVSNEQMAAIAELAERQVTIEAWIESVEEKLKTAKENLRKIAEVALPNAMAEIGMSEFKLTNGTKITIKNEVYASIPKENPGPAYSWLRDKGLDGIIKNEIICRFGKGEDEAAHKAAEALAELGYQPEQKQTIHPSTLKAFVKEQMEKGVDIPLEAFGAHIVDKAKVLLPKQ